MSKIVVLDSGIGGASILKAIRGRIPKANYLYFADTLNAPYGEKSEQDLYRILTGIIDKLNKKGDVFALVLACNTASSLCGARLRRRYDFPIICVEPPIKVAAQMGFKKISVLATPQTLNTNKTIKKFEQDKNLKIEKVPLKNLAKEIDENALNLNYLFLELSKCLKGVKTECAVIGCTHYNFIKSQIETILRCKVVSCEEAVAVQTEKVLAGSCYCCAKPKLRIVLSRPNSKVRRFLKTYLNSDQS